MISKSHMVSVWSVIGGNVCSNSQPLVNKAYTKRMREKFKPQGDAFKAFFLFPFPIWKIFAIFFFYIHALCSSLLEFLTNIECCIPETISWCLGTSVRSDLLFDLKRDHVYVMTDRKLSKVRVQDCQQYKDCNQCLGAKVTSWQLFNDLF